MLKIFFICLSLLGQGLTNSQATKAKQLISLFFHKTTCLQGQFIHIISEQKPEADKAQPTLATEGKELTGTFKIHLQPHATKFKWKYIHPSIIQVIKLPQQHIKYKKGQYQKQSADGIISEPNNCPPKLIPQSLPITFLFETSVDEWSKNITIQSVIEDKKFTKIVFQYPTLVKVGLFKNKQAAQITLTFMKNPFCLVQWQFQDQNSKYNQITLFDIELNKTLTNRDYQID